MKWEKSTIKLQIVKKTGMRIQPSDDRWNGMFCPSRNLKVAFSHCKRHL